jgi:hypothetical protein
MVISQQICPGEMLFVCLTERKAQYTMRRSSDRTARTVVEIEWAGWSQAAISEEDPGEEDGLDVLCWMEDAARLSRCTWEWEGVGRGRGLCYETDRRAKRD